MQINKLHIDFSEGEQVSCPSLPSELYSKVNVRCDITLHKGLHKEGQKLRKIVDLTLEKQRQFLKNKMLDIINRYNVYGQDQIKEGYACYEVQKTSCNVHSHSALQIDIATNPDYAIVKLKDIVKSMGFKIEHCEISFIKDNDSSHNYIMKKQTKVPGYITHYTIPSDV